MAGIRLRRCGHLERPALGHQTPAAFAAFGAEVEDPVGVANDVEIVLDDDDRVAEVGEAVENFKQLADIVEVEAGGGLVEQVEGAAGLALGELAGQLHALRFAATERCRALAEMHVAEADVDKRLQFLIELRHVLEHGECVFDGEVEDVGDRVAVKLHG